MVNDDIRIWVATPSFLIRKSLVSLLRQNSPGLRIQESGERTLPQENIIRFSPNLIIIDEGFFSPLQLANARSSLQFLPSQTRICGITTRNNGLFASSFFDKTISLYESPEKIWESINTLIMPEEIQEQKTGSEDLTEREKQVLVQVVRGLTNKEIGDLLNLSVHTVISHRKNITRKLDIKSSSGLTIYAIMNNLVSLQDVGER